MTVPLVTVETHGDIIVTRLAGDVDMTNRELIAAEILDAVPREALGVVVDLTDVRYLDSAGVQMVLDLVREQGARRQGIAFALPETSPVSRVVTITNMAEAATFRASADECAAALRACDPETF